MMAPRLMLSGLLVLLMASVGCSDSGDSEDAGGNGQGGDGAGSGTMSGDGVPTEADALEAWLSDLNYQDYSAESEVHESEGPHFGGVRTFLNPALDESMANEASEHPVGAAAVKELYGDGSEVLGYAVMVKVAVGAGADTWYFYEEYEGSIYADDVGAGLCANCHTDGQDYILTGYPLL